MRSVGSWNSSRGKRVERTIAERYKGVLSNLSEGPGFDVELEDSLLEVKSCLSYYVFTTRGKKYHYPGRFLIGVEKHEKLKKKADEKNKIPIYVFVKIPRNDNGKIESDPTKWSEVWTKWNNIDRIVKNSNTRKIVKNKWRGYDFTRYYYAIDLDNIFGN